MLRESEFVSSKMTAQLYYHYRYYLEHMQTMFQSLQEFVINIHGPKHHYLCDSVKYMRLVVLRRLSSNVRRTAELNTCSAKDLVKATKLS